MKRLGAKEPDGLINTAEVARECGVRQAALDHHVTHGHIACARYGFKGKCWTPEERDAAKAYFENGRKK